MTSKTQQIALSERELAARWGISPRTLRARRDKNLGPEFIRIGRSVRYLISEIEAIETAGGVK